MLPSSFLARSRLHSSPPCSTRQSHQLDCAGPPLRIASTLSASVIRADDLPEELPRKLPRYPQLPVTLSGRLAIDTTLQGQRMGQFLLMDALWRSLHAAAQIAAMAVVVDAKDKAAEAFYARFGFTPLQQRPARMFLPMKTVANLFP
jgi:GNAT superfamily N-acetyltransferase